MKHNALNSHTFKLNVNTAFDFSDQTLGPPFPLVNGTLEKTLTGMTTLLRMAPVTSGIKSCCLG